MANKVTAQVLGGDAKVLDGVNTVAGVKQRLGVPLHTATVNGEVASDSQELEDFSFVSLAPAVKGGM